MILVKKISRFFDRLEDKIRFNLSNYPFVYTLIGGIAIVLFWRGVWMTADLFAWLNGPMSLLISTLVLLMIGLFVSFFIGDQQILQGLRKEKKLIEKTKEELDLEALSIIHLKEDIKKLSELVEKIISKSS